MECLRCCFPTFFLRRLFFVLALFGVAPVMLKLRIVLYEILRLAEHRALESSQLRCRRDEDK